MNQYRYAGPVPWLKGCTALGRRYKGNFIVQVDQFYTSDWWHHWHATPRHHWRLLYRNDT